MSKKKKKNKIRSDPQNESKVFVYKGATFSDFILPSGYVRESRNPRGLPKNSRFSIWDDYSPDGE